MENINGINFKKYAMTSLTVEKLEDTFKIKNAVINLDTSNEYCILFVHDGPDRWFHTSKVQKQEEYEGYDLLYTLNSVYKITPNFTAITGVQEKHSLTVK